MKGILSLGFIIGVYIFINNGVTLIERGDNILGIMLAAWFLGICVASPFWILFEAIVEKIKE